MKYTNGFDIDEVLPALQQRLGWRQPTVSGSSQLSDENTLSLSNRFFNDGSFHALATIENLKAAQEDPAINDGAFNTYLTNLQSGMIMRSLSEVFRQPELLEQVLLYARYGWNDVALPNQGQFVGWMIDVAPDQGISTQITLATLYFDSDVTFNLYLFQDGVRDAIKTIEVSAVAFQRTEVDFESLVLNFKTGAKYYLLYNQAELGSAQAIREQVQSYAKTNCFQALSIQMAAATDGSIFNRNIRQYPAQPAGINLEMISFKDHTQKILRKVNLFDEVQGLQMAVIIVEAINNSTRTNKTQRQTEQASNQMYMDLNQAFATKEVPVTPGLKSRIAGEFKRLRDTFFPPQRAISLPMENCNNGFDAYEKQWAKQNIDAILNPGVLIT